MKKVKRKIFYIAEQQADHIDDIYKDFVKNGADINKSEIVRALLDTSNTEKAVNNIIKSKGV